MTHTDCEICGYIIYLVWGDEFTKWTGRCWSCGSVVMFLTKDEVCV